MTPDRGQVEGQEACRLCGSSAGTIVLRPSPFVLVRCRSCGLVRTEGSVANYDASYYSAHALSDTMQSLSSGQGGLRARVIDFAYAAYLDRGASRFRRLAALPVRNRLGGLPPRWFSGSDLLDVGSGDGDFLRRASHAGFRAVGQEINAAAVASARRIGADVRLGEIADLDFRPASFDAVRLWHVLEHVEDPIAMLRAVRGLLRPDGLLIVGVPDFSSPARRLFRSRWSGLQLPFHRHHFTSATLRRMLSQGGFRIRSLHHRSVGTIFSSLVRRPGLPGAVAAPAWLGLLAVDDLLDLVGRGDSIEALAVPA